MFVRTTGSARSANWNDDAWTVSAGFIFLAMFTMIATNLAALRDRREHTTEHFETLPVSLALRTSGLLAATVVPAAVAVVLFAAVASFAATQMDLTFVDVIHVPAHVVFVVLLGVLGIALALVRRCWRC